MEKTQRIGLYVSGKDLRKFLHFGENKEEYFIEVTQWDNHEGYTISLNTSLGNRTFEVSYDEFNLLKYMIDKIDIRDLEDDPE